MCIFKKFIEYVKGFIKKDNCCIRLEDTVLDKPKKKKKIKSKGKK